MPSQLQFLHHLPSIPPEQWHRLFALLDEMESTIEFGRMHVGEDEEGRMMMPYMEPAPVVLKFEEIAYELGLVIDFDWPQWDEGREMLFIPDTDYGSLDIVTLCKLITVIIRSDRFVEGNLVDCFENGTVQKIMKALQAKIEPTKTIEY